MKGSQVKRWYRNGFGLILKVDASKVSVSRRRTRTATLQRGNGYLLVAEASSETLREREQTKMPTCICSACKHLNSASCSLCSCCSYKKVACMPVEKGP